MTSQEQSGPTSSATDARLEVSVGNEAFEPGRTQVVLEPDGSVRVTSTLDGGRARRAEAKLDPERASDMIRAAAESVAAARQGKRYGLPDEPRYHFEVSSEEKREAFDVWRSELPERPDLQRIVTTLQQLVDEQVEGEILL